MQSAYGTRFTGTFDMCGAPREFVTGGWMQGKLAKLSLFAITALALATVQPVWGQQPTGQARKLTRLPDGAIVYEDTQWSPDQDIQLLKSNIRSQKKQIVAANLELTDAESEKFWPVTTATQRTWPKFTTTKLHSFRNISKTMTRCLGNRPKVIYAGGPRWKRTSCKFGSNICRSFARCLREGKQRSFTRSTGDSI